MCEVGSVVNSAGSADIVKRGRCLFKAVRMCEADT